MFVNALNFLNLYFDREERRDELDHEWREADEFFKAFAPKNFYPSVASRREDVDSSEEDDDDKASSETPSGWF